MVRHLTSGLLLSACLLQTTSAEEVRYVTENGVTYREVHRVVRRPVADMQVDERNETVYRPRLRSELRSTQRRVLVPVQEWRWEPRWHGVLNPFQSPYVAWRAVPVTRWENRVLEEQVPVTVQEWVEETRTVAVPERRLGFETRREVVSRVAVTAPPAGVETGSGSRVARGVGGVYRYESDPPRESSGAWVRRY